MSPLRRRLMLWIAVPLSFYAVVVFAAFLLQDKLVFVGASWGRNEPLPNVPGVEVSWLTRPNGERFRIATAAPREPARGVVVSFVGNGEDLRSGVQWAALWTDYGLHAVVVEYPGYGDSEGAPGRASIHEAAEAAAAHARETARSLGVRLIAAGSSLGTCPAVHLAAQGLCERLFLRAPLTSIADAGRRHYPWLPVGWLLRHDLDNMSRAADVRCPVLILHGDRDRIVPIELGRELADAIAGPVTFVTAEGYGHNDLSCDRRSPFGERIRAFLAGD